MHQNNCNGENTPTHKIPLINPCNPCNACSECNRCACECTCSLPDYCEDGCVMIIPSTCATYNGVELTVGDQTITPGMEMTNVIEILAGITPPTPEARMFSLESKDNSSNSDINMNDSIQALADRMTMTEERLSAEDYNLQTQINDKLTLSELILDSNDIETNIDNNTLTLNIDYNQFLSNFINFIKENDVNTSMFAQLLNYVNNPDNFINAPFQVSVIPSITTALVQWTKIENAVSYKVFKRLYGDGNFENVGTTPSLGTTISGLIANTKYEFYVISIDTSGNRSLPSRIVTVETLQINS